MFYTSLPKNPPNLIATRALDSSFLCFILARVFWLLFFAAMTVPRKGVEGLPISHDMEARHRSLMQDYDVLKQEHAELKDLLQRAKMRKANLLAEVRFLRRRLKKLKENPSDRKENEPTTRQRDFLPASKTNSQALIQPSPLFSAKNNSIPMLLKPLYREGYAGLPKAIGDSLELVGILKTSAFSNRAKVNVTENARKRKISWQDQISLECS